MGLVGGSRSTASSARAGDQLPPPRKKEGGHDLGNVCQNSPPREITDHLGKPAMVVNMAGESVPMVAICASCHWGYWSPHWTTCVCCKQKRDPVARPEPCVFKHWLVKARAGAVEAPAAKAPAPQPPGLGTSGAQDDLMRMCSPQIQQQQQQQQLQ